jgi:peptide/nickel transport system ATP-binding protein
MFTCGEPEDGASVLEVENLKAYYRDRPSWIGRVLGKEEQCVKAVDDVSLELGSHAVLGIVGESGCGKSTLAKTIAGLVSPSEGKIEFLGEDVAKAVEKRPREVVEELRMVFQNPNSTLNPTQSVEEIIGRPIKLADVVPRGQVEEEVRRWLKAVNLDESYMDRHPRQMSGGEKQRIAIARAFASRPELVICDEPVSSLDVSVKCSVLKALLYIQTSHGTSLAYISHDLSVVHYLCDHILVMYLGKVCESGSCEEIFEPPYHPYTEALLSAVPVPDPTVERSRIHLEGSVPSALKPPQGCRFHTRCPRKVGAICETEEPPFRRAENGHAIACHLPLEALSQIEPIVMGCTSTT